MNIEKENNTVLKTRLHYIVLDGLRGIAALSVVVFHFLEWVYSDYSKNFIGHGFLAVDFFFCLSGFVIGYAYDTRIKTIGIKEFFLSRLIRLHPLVILGSVLGLVGFLVDPFVLQPAPYSGLKISIIFLSSVFLIPYPSMQERAYNLFSFNAPAWSLFWEYMANVVYAFILCKINRRYLLLVVIISGVVLCWVSYRSGNLLGGWSGPTFWDGGARVAYSFSAGLYIYRANWIIKNKIGFAGLTLLLLFAFTMPWFSWDWLAETLVVLFYFPLLVSLGAGTVVSTGTAKICAFSGNLSYPLYMTHYAAIWLFASYYTNAKPPVMNLAFIIIIAVLFLIGFAYLAMRFYDVPVRKYLNKKRKLWQL